MLHWKQCGSWSAGFWRSQLNWIHTVYKRSDICTVLYCFQKCKLFKHRGNLYYRTRKIFFGQVHYGHLLVPGQFSPGRVAQSVTCLATDACLTADPGVASSIPVRSHTFVEIDHEMISTVILLPSADSFKKGCCQLQAKVCARITG